MIAIERKTTADLMSCICSNRKRFRRELQRAACILDFVVVVEGPYHHIRKGNYRGAMNPKSVWEHITAMQ